MRVAFDWQVSSYFGWGVYGLNLALEWAKNPDIEAWSTHPLDFRAIDVDPLRRRALKPFIMRSTRGLPRDTVRLHALGNDLLPESDARIGVIFFEQPLSRAAIERAKRYDIIIAGSSWNEQTLRDAGLDCVTTILQGVDATLFHPAPKQGLFPSKFLIFSGGKAEPRKGQDLVVKAFRIFAARHPEAMLVTAWHSPFRAVKAGMDLDLSGLGDRVIDVGALPNGAMASIYRECDVGLFPSRAEGGTNLVAMECMACGVPVILSKNTGHFDLMGHHGVHALTRQTPSPLCSEWGESDVDEILHLLETAFEERWQHLAYSQIAHMSWAKTASALLSAAAPFHSTAAKAA